MSRSRIKFGRLGVLLGKELRDLARDRKVLCAAIFLPALLFPLLLTFSGQIFATAERQMTPKVMRVGLVGESSGLNQLVRATDRASWARGGSKEQIRSGELDAVVIIGRARSRPERYTVFYDRSRETSLSAYERIMHGLERVVAEERRQMLADAGGGDAALPARDIDVIDLAAASGTKKADVPRLLPMLIVLILLSAAAFAAIDLFPGERERGTLETLLVQPIPVIEVLLAKYLSVVLVGVVAIIANLVGMFAASLVRTDEAGVSLATLACLLVVALPLALFAAALLVRIVARAKSVREAQNYLLPLTLICLLPPLVASSPEVPFDSLTACLPLAGPSLAFREIGLGKLPVLPLLAMLVSTCFFSALVLLGALKHLANEEHLLQVGNPDGPRPGRGLLVVLLSILGLYVFGPLLEGYPILIRLGIPVVLFAGLPPLVAGSWAGIPLSRLLAPHSPNSKAVVVALCAGAGLAMLATSIITLQRGLLPTPKVFRDAAEIALGSPPLSIPVLLLLFAVVPALFEEFLYRRFLLEILLKSTDVTKVVLITSTLFALHHLSIFRFLPTFAAGVVLAWLVLTTHSFWTAPIAHAVSNGLVLLFTVEHSPLFGTAMAEFLTDESWTLTRIPIAIVLIVGPKWLLYHRTLWEPRPRPAG